MLFASSLRVQISPSSSHFPNTVSETQLLRVWEKKICQAYFWKKIRLLVGFFTCAKAKQNDRIEIGK